MPRLSVLLPVHDGQETIQMAVASTLRALPGDSELLVYDDGSTDGTRLKLDRFSDPRLTVHSGGQSVGVAGALNRLLDVSDSAIVARMDADDICLPWRFQRQLGALHAHPSSDVVFSTVVDWHSGPRRLTPHLPVAISPTAFPLHLTLANPASHPTMLATRHALFEASGYRAVPAEDYDLWMRLHLAGFRLRRLALPVLGYRVHAGQVTSADGFRSSSWANPLVAATYGELTAQVLGTVFLRLNVLATASHIAEDDFEDSLAQFTEAVRVASARLGPERHFALRVLRRREREVRELRKRSVGRRSPRSSG